jgi:hypothetical protein
MAVGDGVPSLVWFGVIRRSNSLTLWMPNWLLVLVFATLAAVPWLPWWSKRFSLRTLLIATTLIAVILGAIVYAAK